MLFSFRITTHCDDGFMASPEKGWDAPTSLRQGVKRSSSGPE
jgi:hypothetical protein